MPSLRVDDCADVCICGSPLRPLAAPGPNGADGGRNKTGTATPCPVETLLFSQSQPADDLLISRAIFPREIFQQLISPADQLSNPRREEWSFLWISKCSRSWLIRVGQQRDLHFRRTGILLVDFVIGNDLLFLLG